MNLVKESKKILESLGLLSKKHHDSDRSPNFIGNKSATNLVLDTDIYASSKTIFISESIALDQLRLLVTKQKKKVIYYDRQQEKICIIDKIKKNTKGDSSAFYGEGKTFKGTIDLICFMGLFFSNEEGIVIYDKKELGEEIGLLNRKMMLNSNTKYIALSHDKLSQNINSTYFMNTDNYVKANLIVTPTNIYQFD